MTETLFPVIAVHCFLALSGCDHVVRALDPDAAHDLMEQHYQTAHRAYIDRVTGALR